MKKLSNCTSKKEIKEAIYEVIGNILSLCFVVGFVIFMGFLIHKESYNSGKYDGKYQAEVSCEEEKKEMRENYYKNLKEALERKSK